MPAWLQLSFPANNHNIDGGTTSSSCFTLLGSSSLMSHRLWRGNVEEITIQLAGALKKASRDPATLFHLLLVSLVGITVLVRAVHFQFTRKKSNATSTSAPLETDYENSKEQSLAVENSAAATCTGTGKLQQLQESNLQQALEQKQKQILRHLQYKYLAVFWLLRISFWMSGPYFYAAYASKTNNDASMISLISLAGYASIALVGPYVGTLSDRCGRKRGTLLAATLYALGSISTLSGQLWLLFLGRALGGIGTGLLTAAPEAWLVSEFQQWQQNWEQKKDRLPPTTPQQGSFIQKTLGIAYAYDSVCAIGAGQLAGLAATLAGPTGPFQVSPFFLALGGSLTAVFWNENKAHQATSRVEEDERKSDEIPKQSQSIWDALALIRNDKRIAFLGGVQAFFEGAMYIFVMQWPPTMNRAIQQAFGVSAVTPYGTAFSCFMACCMVGSTVFGLLSGHNKSTKTALQPLTLERQTVGLLGISFVSMVAATAAVSTSTAEMPDADTSNLWHLILAYFAFESCVGMYFPSIGTLRSKYLPNSHRSVIMSLFGVPLNIIVVAVFLLVHKLGNVGALAVASLSLGMATICVIGLYLSEKQRLRKEAIRNRFKKVVRKVQMIQDISDHFREELAKLRTEKAIQQKIQENRSNFFTFSVPQFF